MRPILCLSFLALLGCAAAEPAPAQSRRPEAVYAAVAGRDALRVRFSSNGCTEKKHFRLERRAGGILFRRITPDHCKSFAIGSVWIEYSYAELGVGQDFTLLNPLTPWRGPGE